MKSEELRVKSEKYQTKKSDPKIGSDLFCLVQVVEVGALKKVAGGKFLANNGRCRAKAPASVKQNKKK